MKKSTLYAFGAVLIWSTTAAVVKTLLSNIPNLQALCISSLFACLFLLLINLKCGKTAQRKRYTPKDYAAMAGLGFLGLFVYSALYYYGLSQLSSSEACILNYLWPMMLLLFSCLILKERVTPMKVVAMLCSFAGIVILSSGAGSGSRTAAGIISCVIAAACYGLFSVLNKKADYDQNIAMTVFWLVAAVCSLSGLLTEHWVALTGSQWLGMLWLGIVIDAVAYLLWALGLQTADNTASVANLAYLTPFLSLLVSAVFLKETITMRAIAALCFIIGGLLLQYICDRRKPKPTGGK